MSKVTKSRYWGMVVYPESCQEDWRDMLTLTGLRCAVSPLHDKDINPDAEEEDKKPHWHVLMCWDGPTTTNAAKAIADGAGGVLYPKPINSVRGYYRYLTHQDNPEKYQYDAKDIQHLGGFVITDYEAPTRTEADRLIREIIALVRENNIVEYATLIEALEDEGRADAFVVAATHTLFLSKYIDSRRNRARVITIDPATGEVRD